MEDQKFPPVTAATWTRVSDRQRNAAIDVNQAGSSRLKFEKRIWGSSVMPTALNHAWRTAESPLLP
jgi:hypothetical protein